MSDQVSAYPTISQERFSKQYKVIQNPGTYKAKVLRVSPEIESLSPINPGGTVRIVNLNVVFPHHFDGVKQAFKDGEATYESLNGLTATYNVESNASEEAPVKGEEVRIVVDNYVPTSERAMNKGKEILVVTSMRAVQATVASNASILFSQETVEEESKVEEKAAVEAGDDNPF